MILVERGNLLPTVAVVQYLLNNRLGSSLSIDGDYGANLLSRPPLSKNRIQAYLYASGAGEACKFENPVLPCSCNVNNPTQVSDL